MIWNYRYGIYPLTAYAAKQPPSNRSRAISPETAESVKSVTPEPIDVETRRVVNMMCSVKPREDGCDLLVCIYIIYTRDNCYITAQINNWLHKTQSFDSNATVAIQSLFLMFLSFAKQMTILLRMDDKMNRQLTCEVSQDDDAMILAHELVHLGFIHDVSII